MPLYDYLEKKSKHPEWVWPRADPHMVLGIPGSEECFKTWVEPGNSFSPGTASFGVSVWIYDHIENKFYIPEIMPLEDLKWRFVDGYVPVLTCKWSTKTVAIESRLFKQRKNDQHAYTDTLVLQFKADRDTSISVYLVLRSFGACGGYIGSLALAKNRKDISINGYPLVVGGQMVGKFAAVSYQHDQDDIGNLIISQSLPDKEIADDDDGWASGTAVYDIKLEKEQEKELYWDFPIYLTQANGIHILPFHYPDQKSVKEREQAAISNWRDMLEQVKIDVPDKRFKEAFYAVLAHMLMMIVGDNVRIENMSYPLFWLRDGVYIINSLDKAGHNQLAEKACRILMYRDFLGGMGAEADAPGAGIWPLVEHYKFTKDKIWLGKVYPAIRRKAGWIEKMMTTDEPLYDLNVEMAQYTTRYSPVQGLICMPVKDGLIQGRMDWHMPLFWVNSWSVYGLKMALFAAWELGHEQDAEHFQALEQRLSDALGASVAEQFGKNERDTACALWPTHSLPVNMIAPYYDKWWYDVRCPNGEYKPQYDWPYFEAAQAHGYLFLGQRERAWETLDRFFTIQDIPGLYGYNEGKGAYNKPIMDAGFGDMQGIRGWHPLYCNMPHNWVHAELFLLMRDMLYYEDGDRLIIGKGIPSTWLDSSQVITVRNAITYFGSISFTINKKGDSIIFSYDGPNPPGGIALELPGFNKTYHDEHVSVEEHMC